jgi:ResB-like family.
MNFLHHPWGLIAALIYLYILIVIYVLRDRFTWMKKFSDTKACIITSAGMLALLLVFGLVPQTGSIHSFPDVLGFTKMNHSWLFIVAALCFTTAVTLNTIEDIHHFSRHRIGVTCAHLSLSIILFTGIFFSSDQHHVQVQTIKGIPVGMGQERGTEMMVTLPFELTLKDFYMEEHAPRLRVADLESGSYHQQVLTADQEEGRIGNWKIEIQQFLPSAGRDSAGFVPLKHFGATAAALVKTEDRSGKPVQGWICSGSQVFEESTLQLDRNHILVMLAPEPKSYVSTVGVTMKDGSVKEYSISVNHPATIGHWKIYQKGYDEQMGRWSNRSTLECVRDSSSGIMTAALWIMMAAAVAMIFFAGLKPAFFRKEGRK